MIPAVSPAEYKITSDFPSDEIEHGQPRLRPAPENSERGFVAVATALLMVILVLFAALGIDVAMWMVRSSQLQRTADAAALAAVVRMPRIALAEQLAKEVAAKNKIDPNMVQVERIAGRNREIRVTITDPHSKSFFGKMLRNEVSITRSSRAEFVSQIELGSKLNALGTGNLPTGDPLQPGWAPGGTDQKFWLAVNGKCTPKEDGDRFASAFEGNRLAATGSFCGAPVGGTAMSNQEYPGDYLLTNRPAYGYTVEIPCPIANEDPCSLPRTDDVKIEAYNPHFDPSNLGIDRNTVDGALEYDKFGYSTFKTYFRIYDTEGSSIAGALDAVFRACAIEGCAAEALAGTLPGNNEWYSLFTIPISVGYGKFRVEVATGETNPATPYSFGSNAFSLVAYNQSAGRIPCSGPTCPTLSGERSMSVYANASAAGATDFYLAKLAPARYFRGKRVQVLLWDPGEGAESIQIIQPDTAPAALKFRTWNPGLSDPNGDLNKAKDYNRKSGTTAGPDHEIDVGGLVSGLIPGDMPSWPIAERAGTSTYNGRLLSIELNVPTTYGCTPPTFSPCQEAALPDDGWWKIRYKTAATGVSDRTTWSVQLLGDPVHLVKNP
jgi:Putative Flp pilus-assembly TadE/G-like